MKQKSVKLVRKGDEYTVIVVRNSVQYAPGETLGPSEVTRLCDNKVWEVIIVGAKESEECR